MKTKLQEIIECINNCSDKECKGILLFVTGYMSEKLDWDIYTRAIECGIRANTWQVLSKEPHD